MNQARARDLEIRAERRSQDVAIQDANQDRERLAAYVDQGRARGRVEHEKAQAWAYDDPACGHRSP
jgi:hypothetical protein